MEKSELSKKKYIWKYYKASDGMIHKECYPIIYANSNIVYFKEPGSMYLSNVTTNKIAKSESELKGLIDEIVSDTYTYLRITECYCFEEIDISYYQNNVRKIKRRAELNRLRTVANSRKADYERILKAIRELEVEELGEE